MADVKKDIIIVGDFNFPEIDWVLHYSTNKSFGSTVFLNTLHKLLLQQHAYVRDIMMFNDVSYCQVRHSSLLI